MAGKQSGAAEPLADLGADLPIVDKIRIILSNEEISKIENGKLAKQSGVKAEVFLPSGKAGVQTPTQTFFGNNVGECLTFLAADADNRAIPDWGNRIRAGSPPETNGKVAQ